ncbi:MAG: hypothetical protein IJH83_08460, partial [Coriobacteriales bacterium]|nr:hypothetical protein [Coriobacteriales bacterium]
MSKRSGGSQASSAASPAQVLALKATAMVRERDSFAKQTLAKLLQDARLPKEEKDFAWLLVTGVVSSQGTLDQVIDASLRSPSDIKPDVRDALRISTYELIFLDKPAYAVVDQGVELVRSVAPRAANLANAVLHKIARSAGDFPWGDPDADAGALARQHAHPEWLVRQVIQDRGVDFVRSFLEAGAATAPLFVSGNPFAGTRDWAFDAARFDQDAFDARFLEQSRALDPRIEAYGVSGCYRSMQADAFLSKASVGDGLVAGHRAVVADAAS